jgi:hypothetical protein
VPHPTECHEWRLCHTKQNEWRLCHTKQNLGLSPPYGTATWRVNRRVASSITSTCLRTTRETKFFLNISLNAEPISRDPRHPEHYTYPAIGFNTFFYAYPPIDRQIVGTSQRPQYTYKPICSECMMDAADSRSQVLYTAFGPMQLPWAANAVYYYPGKVDPTTKQQTAMLNSVYPNPSLQHYVLQPHHSRSNQRPALPPWPRE